MEDFKKYFKKIKYVDIGIYVKICKNNNYKNRK